jgi:hypothetical protein
LIQLKTSLINRFYGSNIFLSKKVFRFNIVLIIKRKQLPPILLMVIVKKQIQFTNSKVVLCMAVQNVSAPIVSIL